MEENIDTPKSTPVARSSSIIMLPTSEGACPKEGHILVRLVLIMLKQQGVAWLLFFTPTSCATSLVWQTKSTRYSSALWKITRPYYWLCARGYGRRSAYFSQWTLCGAQTSWNQLHTCRWAGRSPELGIKGTRRYSGSTNFRKSLYLFPRVQSSPGLEDCRRSTSPQSTYSQRHQ